MKKFLSILLLAVALGSCGGSNKESSKEYRTKSKAVYYDEVYVCNGRYAKRFHNDENCKGLRNCRAGIRVMTIEEAEDLGKTPCGYCYGY